MRREHDISSSPSCFLVASLQTEWRSHASTRRSLARRCISRIRFGRDSNVIAVPLVTSLTSGCVISSSCASRVMSYPRPNMVAVQAYDGMHIIYEALKKTEGATDGVRLVDAMKGLSFVSPRGPVTVDPETRELIQNLYIRKVERVDGELITSSSRPFRTSRICRS
jgi:Periplasmic binding protein